MMAADKDQHLPRRHDTLQCTVTSLLRWLQSKYVGSLVFGLALQEPVGNFFNGIMLMIERPIGLGDWVKIGDNVGKVVESNWRSVHLRTRDNNLVVVPNSMLAKGMFINFTGSSPLHKESVKLHFSCDDAPNKVKLVLLEAARRTSGVVSDPPPKSDCTISATPTSNMK